MKGELDLSSAVTLYVVETEAPSYHFIIKMIGKWNTLIHNNVLSTKKIIDHYSNDVYELQILDNTRILCYKCLRLKSIERNWSIGNSQKRINHPQKWHNVGQPEQPQLHLQKKKERNRKEKCDLKMNARRRSVKIYDSKKPFAVTGSDNHTSETHVTGLYTPVATASYDLVCCNLMNILRESVLIFRSEKTWQDMTNESKFGIWHITGFVQIQENCPCTSV